MVIQFFTNHILSQHALPHEVIFKSIENQIVILGQIIENMDHRNLVHYIIFKSEFIHLNMQPFQMRNPLIRVFIIWL